MCSFVSVCVLSLEFLSACVPVVGSVSVCLMHLCSRRCVFVRVLFYLYLCDCELLSRAALAMFSRLIRLD